MEGGDTTKGDKPRKGRHNSYQASSNTVRNIFSNVSAV